MQLFFRFVQFGRLRRWRFGNGSADLPQTLAYHVCTQQIPFLGGKFLRMLFLEVGWLSQNEQLIHQGAVHAGKQPNIHTQAH